MPCTSTFIFTSSSKAERTFCKISYNVFFPVSIFYFIFSIKCIKFKTKKLYGKLGVIKNFTQFFIKTYDYNYSEYKNILKSIQSKSDIIMIRYNSYLPMNFICLFFLVASYCLILEIHHLFIVFFSAL